MVRIQLRAEGTRLVGKDFVLDFASAFSATDAPAALVQFRDCQRQTAIAPSAHPGNVLREIANLVKRVPDGELQLALAGTRRDRNFHLYEMLRCARQGNLVADPRHRQLRRFFRTRRDYGPREECCDGKRNSTSV